MRASAGLSSLDFLFHDASHLLVDQGGSACRLCPESNHFPGPPPWSTTPAPPDDGTSLSSCPGFWPCGLRTQPGVLSSPLLQGFDLQRLLQGFDLQRLLHYPHLLALCRHLSSLLSPFAPTRPAPPATLASWTFPPGRIRPAISSPTGPGAPSLTPRLRKCRVQAGQSRPPIPFLSCCRLVTCYILYVSDR